MTAIETSPGGASRERPVRCIECRRETWNFSCLCNRCRRDWSADRAVLDALAALHHEGDK